VIKINDTVTDTTTGARGRVVEHFVPFERVSFEPRTTTSTRRPSRSWFRPRVCA